MADRARSVYRRCLFRLQAEATQHDGTVAMDGGGGRVGNGGGIGRDLVGFTAADLG